MAWAGESVRAGELSGRQHQPDPTRAIGLVHSVCEVGVFIRLASESGSSPGAAAPPAARWSALAQAVAQISASRKVRCIVHLLRRVGVVDSSLLSQHRGLHGAQRCGRLVLLRGHGPLLLRRKARAVSGLLPHPHALATLGAPVLRQSAVTADLEAPGKQRIARSAIFAAQQPRPRRFGFQPIANSVLPLEVHVEVVLLLEPGRELAKCRSSSRCRLRASSSARRRVIGGSAGVTRLPSS